MSAQAGSKQKDTASDAELVLLNRMLNSLRYKYEEAGPIWEGLALLFHPK